jgi:hypothetical protein
MWLVWGRGEVYSAFWWRNLKGREHLEDPGIEGSTILRWIFRKWAGRGMNRIDLAQDKDRWRALVNSVMNLQVPLNTGNFLTTCEPVHFSRRTLLHTVSERVSE